MKKKQRLLILSVLAVLVTVGAVFAFWPKKVPSLDNGQNFAAYRQFSQDAQEDFYIRQISAEDIADGPAADVKYAKGSLLLIAEDGIASQEIAQLVATVQGEICGHIREIDFYQLQLPENLSYEELLSLCETLRQSPAVRAVHVDLFDVFPEGSDTIDNEAAMWAGLPLAEDDTCRKLLNGIEYPYRKPADSVNVGILDYPVDYTNDDLEVENAADYSMDFLYDGRFTEGAHGTSMAGIIAAKQDNGIGIDGLCSTAKLYSYNAANSTAAYRTAAITRMIAVDGVKVLNFSIAYPPEISVPATLGNENAKQYIQSEADYYAAVFGKLLDQGYEFLICQSAGNENGTILVEKPDSYFGYLVSNDENAPDGILVDQVDATNAFFTSAIDEPRIRDRIIVVGSVDAEQTLSLFSNVGNRVDIVAIGELVPSTYPLNSVTACFGTSIATPFVSGTAAYLFATAPNLTGELAKRTLLNTATPTEHYPMLNIDAAIEQVQPIACPNA